MADSADVRAAIQENIKIQGAIVRQLKTDKAPKEKLPISNESLTAPCPARQVTEICAVDEELQGPVYAGYGKEAIGVSSTSASLPVETRLLACLGSSGGLNSSMGAFFQRGERDPSYHQAPYTSSSDPQFFGPDPTTLYTSLPKASGQEQIDGPWRLPSQSSGAAFTYDPTDCLPPYFSSSSGSGGTAINRAAIVCRRNALRENTDTLKKWLREHPKNPYPTKGEKIMLAIITKMTLTQVSTWFANARRRLKKENKMTWCPKNRCWDADGDRCGDDNDDEGDDNGDDYEGKRCDSGVDVVDVVGGVTGVDWKETVADEPLMERGATEMNTCRREGSGCTQGGQDGSPVSTRHTLAIPCTQLLDGNVPGAPVFWQHHHPHPPDTSFPPLQYPVIQTHQHRLPPPPSQPAQHHVPHHSSLAGRDSYDLNTIRSACNVRTGHTSHPL